MGAIPPTPLERGRVFTTAETWSLGKKLRGIIGMAATPTGFDHERSSTMRLTSHRPGIAYSASTRPEGPARSEHATLANMKRAEKRLWAHDPHIFGVRPHVKR